MSKWPNFTDDELDCSCCGRDNDNPEFEDLMDEIQDMREDLGFAFNVTSAYRCEDHPIESQKDKPGMHNIAAIDINVYGEKALLVLEEALKRGFTGIGVNQTGPLTSRFIHLDMRDGPRVIWSY